MFRRIANSWELIKASAAVLRDDKELLIFPITSAVGIVLVGIVFSLPMLLAGVSDGLFAGGLGVFGIVALFLFYLATYFVIFFASSALVGAAMIRLRGGDPTVSDGFRIAFRHAGAILGYAAIAATVGVIMRMLTERAGGLGRFVISLIGLAWNVATFLVVPVLVVEELGPLAGIKRSVSLLRHTWGEQIAGNLSINLVFGLLGLLTLLFGLPLIVLAASTQAMGLVALGIVLLIVILVGLALVGSTLSGIFTAAVYHFAVTGETGSYFRQELVEQAFRSR
jgi:hypothetical protein